MVRQKHNRKQRRSLWKRVGLATGLAGILIGYTFREQISNSISSFFKEKPKNKLTSKEKEYISKWRLMDISQEPNNMTTNSFEVEVVGNSDPKMKEVRISNTGNEIISNVWLYRQDQPNIYSTKTLVESTTKGLKTDKEKIFALWSLFPRYYYNFDGSLQGGEADDPPTLFGVFGTAQCNNASNVLETLCQVIGCNTRPIGIESKLNNRRLNHRALEIFVDGRWIYLDPDGHVFYLKRDNKSLAGKSCWSRRFIKKSRIS